MAQTKRYYTGVPELKDAPAFREVAESEFSTTQTVDEFLGDERLQEASTGRRDFLKFLGFSVGAATLAACETPVVKSIPYVQKPVTITPGIPNYYASTFYNGQDYSNVLVKTREGRPIFIKPNKADNLTNGDVNARINTSVLDLYDTSRLKGPKAGQDDITWSALDSKVTAALSSANGQVSVLSNTVISPSTQRAIDQFTQRHNARHVMVDSYSYGGMRRAHEATHGKSAIPQFFMDQAKVIVSINADFLGTWLPSNSFGSDYTSRRKPEGKWMSKHFHFEANMSITGSNSDVRTAVKPSEEGLVAAALYNEIVGGSGVQLDAETAARVKDAANALKSNRGESLVVAGSNDENVQMVVNAINQTLGNYGNTLDINTPTRLYQGDDASMSALVNDMKNGRVKVLIIYGTNPGYQWYNTAAFREALAKVGTSVYLGGKADETGAHCTYIAPDHHYLESWNDLEPVAGRVDIQQPTISPLFNTRYAQESFLTWAGDTTDYYTYLRRTHDPMYVADGMFTSEKWNMAVYNGYFDKVGDVVQEVESTSPASEESLDLAPTPAPTFNASSAIAAIKSAASKAGTWELSIYRKVGIGAGEHTANPWCQELPDPISKVTWDNYVTMAPADVEELKLNEIIAQQDPASVITIKAGNVSIQAPVFPSPGQKRGTIGLAMGYGRGANGENIGNAAFQVEPGMSGKHITDDNGNKRPLGTNVLPLVTESKGLPIYMNTNVAIEATEEEYLLATTQMAFTIMGRESIVRETTYGSYKAEADKPKGQASWNKYHTLETADGAIPTSEFDMWKEHPIEVGHRWGMTIDLTTCTGCGACVTACHLENNVPVVGKDEVLRHRDMHWMRIDRFFASEYPTYEETSEELDLGTIPAYKNMERPTENPETVHMPMMCQHCNHAPCETVCPVAATTHSNEGLNQMTYNRCIGTRYCANNCPYKVRRFNWFNYIDFKKFQNANPAQSALTRMVLNPDVTVRSRGVMEKCSMCVQRIQFGKLEAKKAGRPVIDGEVQSACAEACPTHAIQFGDLNDKDAAVNGISKNNRSYHALEEVGVQPNMFYMTKVRNKTDQHA